LFIPFLPSVLSSLQEEREKGYFDESGNYVEKEDKDAEEEAKDAWLQSDEGGWVGGFCGGWEAVRQRMNEKKPDRGQEGRGCGASREIHCQPTHPPVCLPACCALSTHLPACAHRALPTLLFPCLRPAPPAAKVVSAEVRRKIEERERALAAEAAAGPLTLTQIARLQFQASQLLLPGESVAAGLKRLGGHSRRPAKRSKQQQRGGGEGGDADVAAAEVAPDPAAKEQFNQLTEAAMKLMDAGENDVYTQKKVVGHQRGWLRGSFLGGNMQARAGLAWLLARRAAKLSWRPLVSACAGVF
jgi:hypothetical protein